MPERTPAPQTPIQQFVARIQEDRRHKQGRLHYLVVAPFLDGLRYVIHRHLVDTQEPTLVAHRNGHKDLLLAGDMLIRFAHPVDDVRGTPLDGALQSSLCRPDAPALPVMNHLLQRRNGWLLVD